MPLKGTRAKEYQKDYQARFKADLYSRKRLRWEEQKRRLDAAKGRPCMDCGNSYPSFVMDFDHVRGKKYCNISVLRRRSISWKRIESEIAKCDVVCANCHRLRTLARMEASRRAQAADGPPKPIPVGSIPTAGANLALF